MPNRGPPLNRDTTGQVEVSISISSGGVILRQPRDISSRSFNESRFCKAALKKTTERVTVNDTTAFSLAHLERCTVHESGRPFCFMGGEKS